MRWLVLLLLCSCLWGGPSWLPSSRIPLDEVVVVDLRPDGEAMVLVYWTDHNGILWISGGMTELHAIRRMRENIERTRADKWLLAAYKDKVEFHRENKR
jgi:hypothetical protein